MSGAPARRAQPDFPLSARELFDDQFEPSPLAQLLGTDDAAALSLARRATWEPLSQALARPGKGVRARLVELSHEVAREASRGRAALPMPPQLPQLLELLHAGSLIVDDVEDDALLRRGAPALHHLIGAPRAINAGNFLYFLPILALEELPLDDALALRMHRRIARSLTRCHHGQALDLAVRVSDLSQPELRSAAELTSRLKTGALLELACALGAISAGASKHIEQALTHFGCEVGVALQMFDDLSGFLNPSRRDKALEDLLEERATWAWALAAEKTTPERLSLWKQLSREAGAGDQEAAAALIDELSAQLQPLRSLPRARLEAALRLLQQSLGELASIQPLAQELGALERGYV